MKLQAILIFLCTFVSGALRNILETLETHILSSKDKYRVVDTRNRRVFLSSDTMCKCNARSRSAECSLYFASAGQW